tara:strand:- start:166 stop:531 length:366 start_codon:yes stop_codon:yes gene_type:complete
MTVVFAADAQVNPARGVRGGLDGNKGEMYLIDENGKEERAPSVGEVELAPGTWLKGKDASGGGYGNPMTREPARVLEDVLERYISIDRAKDVYGVLFSGNIEDESLRINEEATKQFRKDSI